MRVKHGGMQQAGLRASQPALLSHEQQEEGWQHPAKEPRPAPAPARARALTQDRAQQQAHPPGQQAAHLQLACDSSMSLPSLASFSSTLAPLLHTSLQWGRDAATRLGGEEACWGCASVPVTPGHQA